MIQTAFWFDSSVVFWKSDLENILNFQYFMKANFINIFSICLSLLSFAVMQTVIKNVRSKRNSGQLITFSAYHYFEAYAVLQFLKVSQVPWHPGSHLFSAHLVPYTSKNKWASLSQAACSLIALLFWLCALLVLFSLTPLS